MKVLRTGSNKFKVKDLVGQCIYIAHKGEFRVGLVGYEASRREYFITILETGEAMFVGSDMPFSKFEGYFQEEVSEPGYKTKITFSKEEIESWGKEFREKNVPMLKELEVVFRVTGLHVKFPDNWDFPKQVRLLKKERVKLYEESVPESKPESPKKLKWLRVVIQDKAGKQDNPNGQPPDEILWQTRDGSLSQTYLPEPRPESKMPLGGQETGHQGTQEGTGVSEDQSG